MIVAEGPSGRREIPAAEFFHGVFSTALEPDELIIEVVFPVRHRDVDLSEVRATPGVVEAFVAADLDLADITAMLERPPEEFVPTAMPVLARDKVLPHQVRMARCA